MLNVAELTAQNFASTLKMTAAAVDILDSDLFPQGAHRVFGQDRILLDEAAVNHGSSARTEPLEPRLRMA